MPDAERDSFNRTLKAHGLDLARGRATTLQVNVGYLCNLACRHCHLEAGPARTEIMDGDTMRAVAEHAARGGYQVADITGGAPEMVPGLERLVADLAPHVGTLMLRSNLVAMAEDGRRALLETLAEHKAALVCSLPAVNASQAEAQRGKGVFDASLAMLRRLNDLGWGRPGTGLALHLVSNPAGAFMPPSQAGAEKRFKRELARKAGVSFDRLFVFANMPLGRFGKWLAASGNLESYKAKLAGAFNPCTVDGLMCRELVSVAWDGTLYDCDFNQAAGLPMGGARRHVADLDGPPPEGARIATGEHCFGCTAGSGFT